MSVIKTTCFPVAAERGSGGGEVSCYKPTCYGECTTSHAIVSEIINDIVNNTFEIIMAKELQSTPKITSNVVGDILENIMTPGTNVVSHNNDETVLLDDDIKRIIKEMKCPVEQKNIICTQGIGDQLDGNIKEASSKVITEPLKRDTLERKNRLTNLVRNSKQMLAKFITNESENEVRLTKSEEMNEKILKVIDLEGDEHYMEASCSSTTSILQMPLESTLHMVDLEDNVHNEGEQEIEKTDKKSIESLNEPEIKKGPSYKKKWNLGTKIIKYFKRNKNSIKEDK